MKVTELIYWPPNPKQESWSTDVPNEGLLVTEYGNRLEIASCEPDYHGYMILMGIEFEQPTEQEIKQGIYCPTTPAYREAYDLIELHCPENIKELRALLDPLGWFEVIVDEDEKTGHYFKRVK